MHGRRAAVPWAHTLRKTGGFIAVDADGAFAAAHTFAEAADPLRLDVRLGRLPGPTPQQARVPGGSRPRTLGIQEASFRRDTVAERASG